VVGVRGPPQEGASTFEVGLHLCDFEAQSLESGEFVAECLTLAHIGDGLLQRRLPAAERAGAGVETAAVEAGPGDLESLARPAEAVRPGHARALQGHLPARLCAPAPLRSARAEA